MVGCEQAISEERRYAAKLLFQTRVITAGISNKRRTCEVRIIHLNVPDDRSALRTAKKRGRESQHNYRNSDGGEVRVEFVGVLDLLHLGPECGPDEVWYQMCQILEPMERRDKLLPQELNSPKRTKNKAL